MSPERTLAYRRVTHTLAELGPSKLQSEEQDRVRMAADALIFAADLEDDEAREGLIDVDRLCRALVDSGRWESVTAARLLDDVAACGPDQVQGALLEAA
jgi:uncharacterized circularly permuted ATP-grasp superfamily protein